MFYRLNILNEMCCVNCKMIQIRQKKLTTSFDKQLNNISLSLLNYIVCVRLETVIVRQLIHSHYQTIYDETLSIATRRIQMIFTAIK